MRKWILTRAILFLLLNFFIIPVFAWNHSIELGYGYSQDPNNTRYNNSGFLLSGDIFCLRHTPLTYWSINGALGQWHSTTPEDRNLTTAALSLALRLYPFCQRCYSPYMLASVGPAYLSSENFGKNSQACNFSIQSNIGLGVELKCVDLNLRLVHFSDGNLAQPNDGFNIQYLLSIGYLF